MQNFVLYHGGSCNDGFGAAWSAWTKLRDDAKYIPVQYGEPMPPIPDESMVYILDFSYKKEELRSLAARSEKVVVRDHHKTAKEDLNTLIGTIDNLDIVFDEFKSGAVLAWEHFHPDEKIPRMIEFIDDRDRWVKQIDSCDDYHSALSIEPRDFSRWLQIAEFTEESIRENNCKEMMEFLARGRAINDAKSSYVESLATHAGWTSVGGYRVPFVNSPLFQSEIGERLCQLYPEANFSAVFFVDKSGDEIWSLRSRNGFDVSNVAKQYGGGGHSPAAAYRRKRNQA